MTLYSFTPSVAFGPTSYSGTVLDNVVITAGRTDTSSQPAPATCTVTLLPHLFTGTQQLPALGTVLTVTYTTAPSSTTHTVFTGRVADITVTKTSCTVTAVSSGLGALAQVTLQETWGMLADPVTERARQIYYCYEDENPGRLPTLDTLGTGSVTLAATDYGKGSRALEVLQGIATQEPGAVLFEQGDGSVWLSAARWRRSNASAAPQWTLTDAAVVDDWSATRTIASRVNRATVDYALGTTTYSDGIDRLFFGLYDTQLSTVIATEADAQLAARQLVTFGTNPRWTLDALRVDMTAWDNGTQARAFLSTARVGETVAFTTPPWVELPSYMFLEGWQVTLTARTLFADLYLSDPELSRWPQAWNEVPTARKWNSSQLAGLTWNSLLKTDL
jgi:hypothetical protein